MLRVRAFDHLVLNVADVERSLAWYSGELGLQALRVDEWRAGEVFFPSLRVSDDTIIDLLQVERSGSNVDHLCLVVDPVDVPGLDEALGRFLHAALRKVLTPREALERAALQFQQPGALPAAPETTAGATQPPAGPVETQGEPAPPGSSAPQGVGATPGPHDAIRLPAGSSAENARSTFPARPPWDP